jgi:nitrite reductase (NADH) small subunit
VAGTATEPLGGWVDVCALSDLLPDRGVAALVGGEQVALFRLSAGSIPSAGVSAGNEPDSGQMNAGLSGPNSEGKGETVYAVGNYDPLGGAYVLSRGLVGSRGDRTVVFSPLYKQAYDLATGRCLDDPHATVPIYPVRVHAGRVAVALPSSATPSEPQAGRPPPSA